MPNAIRASQFCYHNMFQGCTNLIKIPQILPATTLSNYCYNGMFMECTNLIEAPELPATTLTDNCYNSMFKGCSSLNNIKVGFIDWNSNNNSTTDWLDGVAQNGTFTKHDIL